jgi:alpha-tubulin suppressor-like RCC1 family protein
VVCWGDATLGRAGYFVENLSASCSPDMIGDGNSTPTCVSEMGTRLVPVALADFADAVVAGGEHTCAILVGGVVSCWGSNDAGQLGAGVASTFEPNSHGEGLLTVSLGTNKRAVALAAGAEHTCALLDDGGVKCWGRNDVGQLGLGDFANRGQTAGGMGDALPALDFGVPDRVTHLAAGGASTCALFDNGRVKCWGGNATAVLGQEDVVNRASPAQVGFIDLGTGFSAAAIAISFHACAVSAEGRVKCWGANGDGKIGLELPAAGDSLKIGDAPGEMGDALPEVDLGFP